MNGLRIVTLAATSAFVAMIAAAGCGGSSDSGFPGPGGDGNGNGNGNGDGNGGGSGFTGSDGGGGTKGDGGPVNVGNVSNCAGTTAQAALKPVNLVFMFDKSGSMNDNDKWTNTTSACQSFFSSPDSKGTSAQLTFFSGNVPRGVDVCSPDTFSTPKVRLTPLPDATDFQAQFKSTNPGGGTPSKAALAGAVAQAQAIAGAAAHKNDATVVVLATDGTPEDSCDTQDPFAQQQMCYEQAQCTSGQQTCEETDTKTQLCKAGLVADVAKAALNGTPSIKTYVIGVTSDPSHDHLENLDAVASAGGTTKATLVDAQNPSNTSGQFLAAINAIRGAEISCNFAIPPNPSGQQINYDAVRVNFTGSNGKAQTFPYKAACGSDGVGWTYNDKNHPTQIDLCSNTCGTVQHDPNGKLNIAYDCMVFAADGGGTGTPIH